jgi:hypothetical protein
MADQMTEAEKVRDAVSARYAATARSVTPGAGSGCTGSAAARGSDPYAGPLGSSVSHAGRRFGRGGCDHAGHERRASSGPSLAGSGPQAAA